MLFEKFVVSKQSTKLAIKRPSKDLIIILIGAALILVFAAYSVLTRPVVSTAIATVNTQEFTVYKSPTCGCCNKWIDHLKDNGFDVKAHNRNDMTTIKADMGIQRKHQSCHTAVINGYVIEGHVPAQDIKRLLSKKPSIHGLTVPGMPMGSPGMEGKHKDKYDVLAIDKKGNAIVFNHY